jgi:poly(3-hydroxybutyrate) depolymerase
MLYALYEYSRALLAPAESMAAMGARLFSEPSSLFAQLPGAPRVAAGYELLYRLTKAYEKPPFGISVVDVRGERVAVLEETVLARPFCELKHFRRLGDKDDVNAALKADPVVLVVAPLSGHYASLLRDTVRTLLSCHDVYLTDWIDARMVPVEEGAFTLDDYVRFMRELMRMLGDRLHVMAVCQPAVPVLSAAALMAAAHEPEPRSLTLMGGPIDPRRSPTQVNEFANGHALSWFKTFMTDEVPARFPGRGRRVYPGFLLHAGFMALNPVRHIGSHWEFYQHLVEGDLNDAEEHRRFYDEFNAVMDLPAEYYLDCIRTIFQEPQLPLGRRYVDGERVAPETITGSSLLTIEGELDNISGPGQTRAAHDLCTGIPAEWKRHLTVDGAGHYGIFSGRRWRTVVYPQVRQFIADAEARRAGALPPLARPAAPQMPGAT